MSAPHTPSHDPNHPLADELAKMNRANWNKPVQSPSDRLAQLNAHQAIHAAMQEPTPANVEAARKAMA